MGPSGIEEVQTITTTADSDDIQGAFRVQIGGELSDDIPHDATAAQLEAILERTGLVRNVAVQRVRSWKRLEGTYRAKQEASGYIFV